MIRRSHMARKRQKKRIRQPSARDREIIDRDADALNSEVFDVLEYQFKLRSIAKRPPTHE